MDFRVTWSPTALDDVEAIAEYINRDSPAYTRAVVNKILDTTRMLEAFPNAGRIVPELDDEKIREHSSTAIGSYIASRTTKFSSLL